MASLTPKMRRNVAVYWLYPATKPVAGTFNQFTEGIPLTTVRGSRLGCSPGYGQRLFAPVGYASNNRKSSQLFAISNRRGIGSGRRCKISIISYTEKMGDVKTSTRAWPLAACPCLAGKQLPVIGRRG